MTTLSEKHITEICQRGQGSACCSYLGYTGQRACLKGTPSQAIIDERRAEGSMKASGDNCSGPPDFTPSAAMSGFAE